MCQVFTGRSALSRPTLSLPFAYRTKVIRPVGGISETDQVVRHAVSYIVAADLMTVDRHRDHGCPVVGVGQPTPFNLTATTGMPAGHAQPLRSVRFRTRHASRSPRRRGSGT